jgi:shikimate kinase
LSLFAERNLVLTGFMGTGKTSVGRIAGERLHMPFVDVDAEIEAREGQAVAEIFRARGEAYFRDVESAVVRALAGRTGVVIATGGGALLRAENRAALAGTGLIMCLEAAPEEIARRLAGDTARPLLGGEVASDGASGRAVTRIRALLDERAPVYAALPYHVDTTGKTPQQVADEVIDLWINVNARLQNLTAD